MNTKYLHIAPKKRIDQIQESGILNNDKHKQWGTYGKVGGNLIPVKAFVYDLLKISESKYSLNAPWVDDQFIKTIIAGSILKIIPKFVQAYKVDLFDALIFEIDISSKFIVENYASYSDGKKIYYETALLKETPIFSAERISGYDAAEILGLEYPYVAFKHKTDQYCEDILKGSLKLNPKTFID